MKNKQLYLQDVLNGKELYELSNRIIVQYSKMSGIYIETIKEILEELWIDLTAAVPYDKEYEYEKEMMRTIGRKINLYIEMQRYKIKGE